MKHGSRFLGSIQYSREDVYTFPEGPAGFERFTQYMLVQTDETGPVQWLVGLEEGGPELALLDPALVTEYCVHSRDLCPGTMRRLGASSMRDLMVLCVLTVPDQIRKTSIDLRAPILLNPATGRATQLVLPASLRQPIRKQIYWDLVPGDPLDRSGMVIAHRKVGETIEIGPDITVQVMELADGGVRLGVYAPRRVQVSRGKHPVTPGHENIRANEEMCLGNLELLMSTFGQWREANREGVGLHATEAEDAGIVTQADEERHLDLSSVRLVSATGGRGGAVESQTGIRRSAG